MTYSRVKYCLDANMSYYPTTQYSFEVSLASNLVAARCFSFPVEPSGDCPLLKWLYNAGICIYIYIYIFVYTVCVHVCIDKQKTDK